MDKVTAAMVLTSLSTSPLVRSPPVRPNGKPRVCALRKSEASPGDLFPPKPEVISNREMGEMETLGLLGPQHPQVLTWAAHIY